MEETKINFNTAKLAKEKGFDWLCNNYTNERDGDSFSNKNTMIGYDNYNSIYATYSRPTQSLLQKWLREVHGIYVYAKVSSYPSDIHKGYSDYEIYKKDMETIRNGLCNTYEQALEVGLQEALKLIKL